MLKRVVCKHILFGTQEAVLKSVALFCTIFGLFGKSVIPMLVAESL